MAISATRPFLIDFNHTTSSLPIEGRVVGRNQSSPFIIPSCPSPGLAGNLHAPRRVQSSLNLNSSSRLTRCINGQITPASTEGSVLNQQQSQSLLSPPADNSTSHNYDAGFRLPSSRYQDPRNDLSNTSHTAQANAYNVPKPLRSPIRFDVDIDTKQVDGKANAEALPIPETPERAIFDDEASSFQSSDWELNVPRRRLSYGEPLELGKARSFHRIPGYRNLRPKVRWPSAEKDCSSWVEETIRATRPFCSEPSRARSRLWLDFGSDETEEKIEEAVSHSCRVPTEPTVDVYQSKQQR